MYINFYKNVIYFIKNNGCDTMEKIFMTIDEQVQILKDKNLIVEDVEYTKDKSIQYIRAKDMILEYIKNNFQITNEKTRELCGFTKQQARNALDRMRNEGLIKLVGVGKSSKYIMVE